MESLNIEKMSIRISKELKEEIEKLNIDTRAPLGKEEL